MTRTDPVWDEGLRQHGIQGIVKLKFVIDREGKVADPVILSSPDDRLTSVALRTIRQWIFKPARVNGVPVAVYYSFTFKFTSQPG